MVCLTLAAIGTGAGLIYGGTRTARDGGWDWEKGAAGALSGAQIGLGVALISRGYGPKSNKDLLGQTLVGSGLGGLMSIESDSPMSWKHWGDGTIVGGATAAGAALGQRYGGSKGMIIGSMLGNAAGQTLSVGLGLRDQVSVEEIAMTGVTTAAFVGMGAAAGQAAKRASSAAATAAGRAVISAAGRAGTAISEAASGGARMIGRGLKHRYGEEAIRNWVRHDGEDDLPQATRMGRDVKGRSDAKGLRSNRQGWSANQSAPYSRRRTWANGRDSWTYSSEIFKTVARAYRRW